MDLSKLSIFRVYDKELRYINQSMATTQLATMPGIHSRVDLGAINTEF